MPTRYRAFTERLVETLKGGDPSSLPNTFVRANDQPGLLLVVGRTKSTYCVEGRVRGAGTFRRITLGVVGRIALQEARQQAREALAALGRGEDPTARRRAAARATVTLTEALEALVAARPLKPASVYDYRRAVSALGWGSRPLASITPDDVLAAWKKLPGKGTTKARHMRGFASVWNSARARTPELPICPVRILQEIKRGWRAAPRRTSVVPDAVLPKWFRAVLALDRDDVRDWLLTLHYTGMRKAEPQKLERRDVDLQARTVRLRDGKVHAELELPFPRQLAAVFRRRLAAIPDEPTAKLFAFKDCRGAIAQIRMVHPWQPSDSRRLFATALRRAGADDLFARSLLGHARGPGAHEGYVIASPDVLRATQQEAADFLDSRAKARP